MKKPCKIYTKSNDKNGYGIRERSFNGKLVGSVLVHRQTWIDSNGPPPPDKPFILHKCNNPPCYEIEHLYVGTQKDNVKDMVNAGHHSNTNKTHCPKGHKLSFRKSQKYGKKICKICTATQWQKWYSNNKEQYLLNKKRC